MTAVGMTNEQEDLSSLADIPFLAFLGVTAAEVENGRSVLLLDQQLHHQNSLDMAHGGVIMAMLDVAMARAGRSLARPDQGEATMLITIEMKTTFLQPARGALRAEGRVIQRTSGLAFCEAELFGADGRRAAHATGTFKYIKRRNQTS